MKILTLNFLTCARKVCKTNPLSFPLHPKDAVLEYAPTSEMTSESTEESAEEAESKTEEEQREEAELQESQVLFLQNISPRLEYPALRSLCGELGLKFPWEGEVPPEAELLWEKDSSMKGGDDVQGEGMEVDEEEKGGLQNEEESSQEPKKPSKLARELHRILLETVITEGKLVCGACGHEYAIKEGIANFLLPGHLV